jgi:hypothetical protein
MCLLLLAQRNDVGDALRVASNIRLSFPRVQEALRTQQSTGLDSLHAGLEQDYEILTGLLRDTRASDSIERRILTVDYKALQLWYRVARTNPDLLQARKAIHEMSSIVCFFAAEFCASAGA